MVLGPEVWFVGSRIAWAADRRRPPARRSDSTRLDSVAAPPHCSAPPRARVHSLHYSTSSSPLLSSLVSRPRLRVRGLPLYIKRVHSGDTTRLVSSRLDSTPTRVEWSAACVRFAASGCFVVESSRAARFVLFCFLVLCLLCRCERLDARALPSRATCAHNCGPLRWLRARVESGGASCRQSLKFKIPNGRAAARRRSVQLLWALERASAAAPPLPPRHARARAPSFPSRRGAEPSRANGAEQIGRKRRARSAAQFDAHRCLQFLRRVASPRVALRCESSALQTSARWLQSAPLRFAPFFRYSLSQSLHCAELSWAKRPLVCAPFRLSRHPMLTFGITPLNSGTGARLSRFNY